MPDFEGTTAVVTGGGRGLGEAMGKALAREGINVVVADLDFPEAQRVASAIEADGGKAMAMQVDITDDGSAKQMVDAVAARCASIDVLLNNAGIQTFIGPLDETPIDAWDKVFSVNVRGHFLVTRAVLPHMIARKSGLIVNTTSNTARVGFRKGRPLTAYYTTKFAMEGFTWALSVELEKHNIRVNAIAPEVADTHFFLPEQRAALQKREVWSHDHTVDPLLHFLHSNVTGTSIDAEKWHEERGTKAKFCRFGVG